MTPAVYTIDVEKREVTVVGPGNYGTGIWAFKWLRAWALDGWRLNHNAATFEPKRIEAYKVAYDELLDRGLIQD